MTRVSYTFTSIELDDFHSPPQGRFSMADLCSNKVLNLHHPVEGCLSSFCAPSSPPWRHREESNSSELYKTWLKWPQKCRREQKEPNRSLKRRIERRGAEQREGDGSRAGRPSSELPVCLHSRAAAASTSVAPSGYLPPPPITHHPPSATLPPLPPFPYLFIYLWFPSTTREPAGTQNKDGGYREREGWWRCRWGGKQRVFLLARVDSTHVV